MGVASSWCTLLFPLFLLIPSSSFPPACAAEYVEGGGAYLGLCAGAYYACARVEFEPGSRWGSRCRRTVGLRVGCMARGMLSPASPLCSQSLSRPLRP